MSIYYVENQVTDEVLADFDERTENTPKEKRLGLFYARRHYAALQRDQAGGHHWNYLSGTGQDGVREFHCTCGLVVKGTIDPSKLVELPHGLIKDEVNAVRGHRLLPGAIEHSVALIVEFVYDSQVHQYRCRAYCQSCLAVTEWVTNKAARTWVAEHNSSCATDQLLRR